jgi:hypothetical protein
MVGMKRLRFNLRTLLVIVALVAMFLGYAQWRRQSIQREAKELEAVGFTLLWQDTWADWIWPVVPAEAAYDHRMSPYAKIEITSGSSAEREFSIFYHKACDQLRALGVEIVRLDEDGKPGDSYTTTGYGKYRESISNSTR